MLCSYDTSAQIFLFFSEMYGDQTDNMHADIRALGLKEFEELPSVSWVNKSHLYTSKAPHIRSLSSCSELRAKSFIHCCH